MLSLLLIANCLIIVADYHLINVNLCFKCESNFNFGSALYVTS